MTDRDNTATPGTTPDHALGQLLRSLRRVRGMTQEALASRSDLSTDTIRRVERGQLAPSLPTLRQIAQGLGLRLSTIVTLLEQDSPDVLLAQTIDLLSTCDDRTLEIIAAMIHTMRTK